jgi:hypothetical protein
MKSQADKYRIDQHHFDEGEWVYLKLQPHICLDFGGKARRSQSCVPLLWVISNHTEVWKVAIQTCLVIAKFIR